MYYSNNTFKLDMCVSYKSYRMATVYSVISISCSLFKYWTPFSRSWLLTCMQCIHTKSPTCRATQALQEITSFLYLPGVPICKGVLQALIPNLSYSFNAMLGKYFSENNLECVKLHGGGLRVWYFLLRFGLGYFLFPLYPVVDTRLFVFLYVCLLRATPLGIWNGVEWIFLTIRVWS